MSAVEDTQSPQIEGFRVFVGNLAYNVSNEGLKEFFAEAGNVYVCLGLEGENDDTNFGLCLRDCVNDFKFYLTFPAAHYTILLLIFFFSVDAVAVRRYGRSLGYGFVVFDTEVAQEKAINMKEAELEGRKINVEKAVPASERPPRPEGMRSRGRGGRRGRGNRRPREPLSGEPSTTVVFVGNLPFNAVDDDLKNIFEGFTVSNAHVVRRFDGASRGFGFVTLATEEEQKKALEALSEVYCDDRRLIVRQALSRDEHKSEVHHDIVIKSENKESV